MCKPMEVRVYVVNIPGKGLGVVAKRDLPEHTIVARYEFRVVQRARAPAGQFRVDVDRKHIGKPYLSTFKPPIGGVANVGALLNEPTASMGQTANCTRSASQYWGRHPHKIGAFVLRTTQPVMTGEELTWNYGPGYGRRAY